MRDKIDILLEECINSVKNFDLSQLDYFSRYDFINEIMYRISAKPILENRVLLRKGEVDCDSWSCPSCKHEFDYNELHFNYCPWCGQRLNWDFSKDFKEDVYD